MDMLIRHFGVSGRDMVGVLQRARNAAPPVARYLLCRPMGQEAVRSAAAFRVVAERLTREGCDVLRFDYHGTGDSPGEEGDQSLVGWVGDVAAAHEQLEPGLATLVNWFGMGLGANLALRACMQVAVAPAHLVLWEPILDGASYARTLLDAHRAELSREFGFPWPVLIANGYATEPALPGDVLGFDVGPTLASELEQLPALALGQALQRGIRVTCAVQPEHRQYFSALLDSTQVDIQVIESRVNWMSSQAMGTAIAPADMPRILLATLG